MKPLLLFTLCVVASGTANAQNIINANAFFNPDFKVRRAGATGNVNASVNGASVSTSSGAWTHSAGGFVQARTEIPFLATVDTQLFAYTETKDNSLIFGREITTQVQLFGLFDAGPTLQGLLNQVTGASLSYDWQASTTVSGLVIVPDQLYRVDFSVTSGNGLPVSLIDSASFGITTAGISGASNESAELLNLLNLVSLKNNSSTGDFSFVFKSSQNRSALDFTFAASAGVDANLLGATAANNQQVLKFSGFQISAIPEPGSLTLCGVFISLAALRRRRDS